MGIESQKKTKNKEKMKRFGTKTSKHIRISQQFRVTPDFGIQPKKKIKNKKIKNKIYISE